MSPIPMEKMALGSRPINLIPSENTPVRLFWRWFLVSALALFLLAGTPHQGSAEEPTQTSEALDEDNESSTSKDVAGPKHSDELEKTNSSPKIKKEEDPKFDELLLSVEVVDSQTKKPIEEANLLRGIDYNLERDDPDPRPRIQWQPHTLESSPNGVFTLPRERAYERFRVRIEAEGYRPYFSQEIITKQQLDLLELKVELVATEPIEGKVITPDGSPAAEARGAVTLLSRSVTIKDGALQLPQIPMNDPVTEWRSAPVVIADKKGNLVLPPEVDRGLVLVTHSTGFAAIPYQEWETDRSVILQEWARLEGSVEWGEKPGVGERILLIASLDDYQFYCSLETTSDESGKFQFERIPPIPVQISRITKGKNGEYYFPNKHIALQSGNKNRVVIGGLGGKLQGEILGIENLSGTKVSLVLDPPPFDFALSGETNPYHAYSEFLNSEAGKNYSRKDIPINPDGTFEVEHLPEATYWVEVKQGDKFVYRGKLNMPDSEVHRWSEKLPANNP